MQFSSAIQQSAQHTHPPTWTRGLWNRNVTAWAWDDFYAKSPEIRRGGARPTGLKIRRAKKKTCGKKKEKNDNVARDLRIALTSYTEGGTTTIDGLKRHPEVNRLWKNCVRVFRFVQSSPPPQLVVFYPSSSRAPDRSDSISSRQHISSPDVCEFPVLFFFLECEKSTTTAAFEWCGIATEMAVSSVYVYVSDDGVLLYSLFTGASNSIARCAKIAREKKNNQTTSTYT